MKKCMSLVAFVSVVLASGTAVADEGAAAAASTVGYGAAGCGLGSMLFGAKPGMVQVLAATTNASSYSQTFGITTGTSNCDSGGGGTASAKVFIEANREALAKDVSRGQGETIIGLAAIAGCADSNAVGVKLQSEFGTVFPDASVSSDNVTTSVLKVLQSDAALACSNLST